MSNELRKLDAEVAEKVMGWLRWDGEDDWNGPAHTTFFCSDSQWLTVYEGGAEEPTQYFSPSTDIAAAFQVAEKMTATNTNWEVEIDQQRGSSEKWKVIFWDGSDPSAQAGAETLPLAICRAALKAVTNTDVPALSNTQ